jgi:hypothetical protein
LMGKRIQPEMRKHHEYNAHHNYENRRAPSSTARL